MNVWEVKAEGRRQRAEVVFILGGIIGCLVFNGKEERRFGFLWCIGVGYGGVGQMLNDVMSRRLGLISHQVNLKQDKKFKNQGLMALYDQ